MHPVHQAIIRHIREASATENSKLVAHFTSLTDEQIIRRMFSNYRGGRGLRLTQFGLQIMRYYFRGYEISVPNDELLQPLHLIFLDGSARMPYYCGDGTIVVYDEILGMKLRLVDGRLSTLMDIEVR